MHCGICKHFDEIRTALEPCASCRSSTDACDRCAVMKDFRKVDRACSECSAGNDHNEIHFDGAPGGLAQVIAQAGLSPDLPPRHAPAGETGVTNLDAEIEDKLRVLLATVMQLEPLDLLLVQHCFTRLPLSRFRVTLRELKQRLSKRYDLREKDEHGRTVTSFRAIVSFRAKRIAEKVPALAAVFAR